MGKDSGVKRAASPVSRSAKAKQRLPLQPISLQHDLPLHAATKKNDCPETPKRKNDGWSSPHVLMASPIQTDALNPLMEAKPPRSRRCRIATPEPSEGYKVRRMYL